MTNPIADAKPGTTWVLDPGRSSLTFRTKTFWGAFTVKGTFGTMTGDGEITAAGTVAGRVRVDAASLSTGMGKRDEHLRSADFFDVEQYPEITVDVRGAEPSGTDRVDLDVSLAVKATTRRLVVPATTELLDDGAVRITARSKLDRTEYGVDGNLIGMIPNTTRIDGVAVFTPRAGAAS